MDFKHAIRYVLVAAIVIAAAFLLQTSVFSNFELAGVTPNFILIITTAYGLIRGEKNGMLVGFFAGLLLDFFSSTLIGMYAFIYMLIGLLSGFFKRLFFGDDIKLPLIFIGINDVIYGILMYVIFFALDKKLDVLFYLNGVILPEAIYTILVAIPVYYALLKMHERFDKEQQRSRNTLV